MYYLPEAAATEDQSVRERTASVKGLQTKLADLEDQLITSVRAVVESEKLLHNHLNKNTAENLRDVFSEVERQLTDFDTELKKADQNNPFIKSLQQESTTISSGVKKTDEGLENLMDIWSNLNK